MPGTYISPAETGFYFLNSRYYNPRTGRFLNADTVTVLPLSPTLLTDKNLFAYCDNNPVVRVDQNGEWYNVLIGAAIGGVTNFVSSVIDSYVEYKTPFRWSVLVSTVIGAGEGTLIAVCPSASVAISAGAGAIESGINGLIDLNTNNRNTDPMDDVSASDIIVSIIVSTAFGAIGGSGDVDIVKGGYVNDIFKAYKAFLPGTNPKFKDIAVTLAVKAEQRVVKTYITSQVETVAITFVQRFVGTLISGISSILYIGETS